MLYAKRRTDTFKSFLRHLTGGLDLAAEWAGFTTVGQCEWADYPTKVLEKHWPDVPRWRDIHDLSADDFRRRTGIEQPTIISGGFPCQPHSVAGKRKASGDERDMWPEYRRIVSEIRPKWVVAENVPGLLSSESGRFFRGILRNFADMGFNVGWCVISAASVGACHRRERMAIVAHSNSFVKMRNIEEQVHREQDIQSSEATRSIANWSGRCNEYQPKLLRNFHGIPRAMDRIKCLGNAVVPQQFYPIFQAIANMESGDNNS